MRGALNFYALALLALPFSPVTAGVLLPAIARSSASAPCQAHPYEAGNFIAAICQHIPEKCFQMLRYFGFYSNKSRGIRRKQGILSPCDEFLQSHHKKVDHFLK